MSDLDDLIRSSVNGVFARGLLGGDLRRALLTEGWEELFDANPAAAVVGLAGEQGRLLVERSPALDLVMVSTLRRELPAGAVALDPAALAVVIPVAGAGDDPVCGSIDGDRVTARGWATAGAGDAAQLLVAAVSVDDQQLRLSVVDRGDAGVAISPIEGIDPRAGLFRVELSGAEAACVPIEDNRRAWSAAVATGRTALGFELLGVADTMLEMTTEYVGGRKQFGRAVGSFQAVRHRLSDVHVAVSAARLGLQEAASRPDPMRAAIAKALAGDAHRSASTWCLQVHGAVGFTWEHGLHRFMRRGWVVDSLLGSRDELDGWVGQRLWDEGVVPRLAELTSS